MDPWTRWSARELRDLLNRDEQRWAMADVVELGLRQQLLVLVLQRLDEPQLIDHLAELVLASEQVEADFLA